MSELLGLTTVDTLDTLGKEQEGRTAHAMKTAMPSAAGMHAKLVKADFHGSIMTGRSFFPCSQSAFFLVDTVAGYDDTVRRSKNASLVGVSGIVVQETENTFKVVTRKDKLKGERVSLLPFMYVCIDCFTVLPKQGSVFAFAVPLYSIESKSEPSRSASAAAHAATGSGTNSGTNGRDAADARETRTVLDDPHIEFELYGNQFCFRAADRAGRKFKHKETIEL